MTAQAIIGVSFALLFGLALAIISSALAPEERVKDIGLFLGATVLVRYARYLRTDRYRSH